MIGYGLLNSSIQNFALKRIISSFFERSSIFLFPLYHLLVKQSVVKTSEEIFTSLTSGKGVELNLLYNLFCTEEDALLGDDKKIFFLKYLFSANVAKQPAYDFTQKQMDKIIVEGKDNFKQLFTESLEDFFSNEKYTPKLLDAEGLTQKYYNKMVEFIYIQENGGIPQIKIPDSPFGKFTIPTISTSIDFDFSKTGFPQFPKVGVLPEKVVDQISGNIKFDELAGNFNDDTSLGYNSKFIGVLAKKMADIYLKENKTIISFYEEKKLLLARASSLELLDSQINSLQESK